MNQTHDHALHRSGTTHRHWTLRYRHDRPATIDIAAADPLVWQSIQPGKAIEVEIDGSPITIEDVFEVICQSSSQPAITLIPGVAILNRIGAAGNGRRHGMTGGLIHVRGDAGDLAGHRMRRGTILVDGDVGEFAGASMTAGTLIVAGSIQTGAMEAARRGTLITNARPPLPPSRYSRPVSVDCNWATVLSRHLPIGPAEKLTKRIGQTAAWTSRGDRSVGGQAEILWPAKGCVQ